MTRNLEPGAHRNLIGLKVSDDMLALIEAMRGETPIQDFMRGLISNAVKRDWWGQPKVALELPDWERRAREAERKLRLVREALGEEELQVPVVQRLVRR